MTLPSSLTDLYVGGNKFTSLSGSFPSTLKLLYVHDLPLKNSLADATLSSSIVLLYVQRCSQVYLLTEQAKLTLLYCACGFQITGQLGPDDNRQRQAARQPHQHVRLCTYPTRLIRP